MNQSERIHPQADRLELLPQCARGTEMGTLLRMFWQPVARSAALAAGHARTVRMQHVAQSEPRVDGEVVEPERETGSISVAFELGKSHVRQREPIGERQDLIDPVVPDRLAGLMCEKDEHLLFF